MQVSSWAGGLFIEPRAGLKVCTWLISTSHFAQSTSHATILMSLELLLCSWLLFSIDSRSNQGNNSSSQLQHEVATSSFLYAGYSLPVQDSWHPGLWNSRLYSFTISEGILHSRLVGSYKQFVLQAQLNGNIILAQQKNTNPTKQCRQRKLLSLHCYPSSAFGPALKRNIFVVN